MERAGRDWSKERSVTRAELTEHTETEYRNVTRLLDEFPPDSVISRPVVGHWNIKDWLGHIGYWLVGCVARMQAARRGEPIRRLFVGDSIEEQVNARNQVALVERRAWPFERVRAEYETSVHDFLAELNDLSDDQLNAHPGEGWPEDYSVGYIWCRNSVEHPCEHLAALQAARVSE